MAIIYMPLIKSGGITQSPWPEGQTTRNLEPLGIIKFDLLGLENYLSERVMAHSKLNWKLKSTLA
jgi:hypothetical protein